jgi:anti-sigma factor RsiW
MKCLTREHIQKYADGELSREERRTVDAHLKVCPECRFLYEKMEGFEGVLRAAGASGIASALGTAAPCPDEEIIASLMDGSLPGGEERARVAAHIAVCGACAVKAADAAETAQLVDRIEARGLDRPPLGLVEAVRDRLCRKGPVSLGEFSASVRDLIARFAGWAEAAAAGPALASIAEPGMGYAAERTMLICPMPGKKPESTRAPKRKTLRREHVKSHSLCKSPEKAPGARTGMEPVPETYGEPTLTRSFSHGDLAVQLSLAATGRMMIECTVRLMDRWGKPLSSVPVEMRKGTATLHTEPTGGAGEAVFGDLVAGNYQFFIRQGEGARVGLTLA